MQTDTIIKADNLYFSYDDDTTHSLCGLSLDIYRGEKIAVMGANGSGKSTFFLCCNGILKPESGTLCYDGKPIEYTKKELLKLRQKVGIVFQDPDNQLFSASVYQDIAFGPLNLGFSKDSVEKKVDAIVDRLGISKYKDKPTHALSGGQKKLVSIADILVMEPEVVILDEPASSLDPKHANILKSIIDQMTKKQMTVIISTHDVTFAYEWADRIILFADGKVIANGTPKEIFSNTALLAKANLTQPPILRIFYQLCNTGVLHDTLKPPKDVKTLEQYLKNPRSTYTHE